MERHESVSEEYIAELEAAFLAKAHWVKSAPDWDETQRRMQSGTYPFVVALKRAEEGWDRSRIESELKPSAGSYCCTLGRF
jgi:hypothetical protein